MGAWLYQMSAADWAPERYREEVWEGHVTRWPARKVSGDEEPVEGDLFLAWYAKTGCDDPGLYGWGIIARGVNEYGYLSWQPVFPSDYLKMHPLFDEEVDRVISAIRGPVPQGTMWPIAKPHLAELRAGVRKHLA